VLSQKPLRPSRLRHARPSGTGRAPSRCAPRRSPRQDAGGLSPGAGPLAGGRHLRGRRHRSRRALRRDRARPRGALGPV